jgi:hypothetical protein
MPKRKPILIACPEHLRFVAGTYECDESGRYKLDADGGFALTRARCGQDAGRCAQTLCALHRYNRKGPGSWYPVDIRALSEGEPKTQPKPDFTRGDGSDGHIVDCEC